MLGHRPVNSESGTEHPSIPSYQGISQDILTLSRNLPSTSMRVPFFFLQYKGICAPLEDSLAKENEAHKSSLSVQLVAVLQAMC